MEAFMTLYDCHIHLLNINNVPSQFLGVYLPLRKSLMLWMAEKLSGMWPGDKDLLENIAEFQTHMGSTSEANYLGINKEYPAGSQLVCLCLDLSSVYGPMKVPYITQVMQMLALKKKYGNLKIFTHFNPNTANAGNIFEYCFSDKGPVLADGVKLYPPMDSPVDHIRLLPVYTACEARCIPITTHCSKGGISAPTFWASLFKGYMADPKYWEPILEKFPLLKINFAHFGGGVTSWEKTIINLMKKYPNVYTDTSGSCGIDCRMKSYKYWLNKEPILADRLLYGSDYFITDILDRSVQSCMTRIKRFIGEDTFKKISEVNPVKFLSAS
jgi:predicted TIM-barrel fold metal-dependent hydrolase